MSLYLCQNSTRRRRNLSRVSLTVVSDSKAKAISQICAMYKMEVKDLGLLNLDGILEDYCYDDTPLREY